MLHWRSAGVSPSKHIAVKLTRTELSVFECGISNGEYGSPFTAQLQILLLKKTILIERSSHCSSLQSTAMGTEVPLELFSRTAPLHTWTEEHWTQLAMNSTTITKIFPGII